MDQHIIDAAVTVAHVHIFLHALKPKADTLNTHWVSNVFGERNSVDY